jgi:hypothetical protein
MLKCGGVKAMVNMAKWLATFVNGPINKSSLGAKTQATTYIARMGFLLIMWLHHQWTIIFGI